MALVDDLGLQEKWEVLWFWDNVVWPTQNKASEPNVERSNYSSSIDDFSEKSCERLDVVQQEQEKQSDLQQGGDPEQEKQERHEVFHQAVGLFERRHRRSLSDDMRLDMSKVLSTRREGPNSLDATVKVDLQSSVVKVSQHSDRVPKLETIASGKEFKEPSQIKMVPKVQHAALQHRERRRGTKSLTDLEYDEIKGFSELGFTFTEDALTPRVVQMLPGLQRLGKPETIIAPNHNLTRPYLSEAWWVPRPDVPVLNWHVSAPNMQGVELKEHLKFWAHAVASTVKMEC